VGLIFAAVKMFHRFSEMEVLFSEIIYSFHFLKNLIYPYFKLYYHVYKAIAAVW